MRHVYSGADVVIAANCAADVIAGTFRTRLVEKSVELQWRFEIKRDEILVVQAGNELKQKCQNQTVYLRQNHVPELEETLGIDSSRWANRGGTMQEDFMATRLLVFQDKTVTWECVSKSRKRRRYR